MGIDPAPLAAGMESEPIALDLCHDGEIPCIRLQVGDTTVSLTNEGFDELAQTIAAAHARLRGPQVAAAAQAPPLHVLEAMTRPSGRGLVALSAVGDTTSVAEAIAAASSELVGAGLFRLAEEAVARATVLAPNAAPLVAAAGTLALARGSVDEAASLYARALAVDSSCQEARKGLADVATDLGEIDAAADRYAELGAPPRVSIVIPVFNRIDLTKQCLDAVHRTTPAGLYEVIVVDNASSDGTTEFLRQERAANRLKAVVNDTNLGFGRACNRAARLARGEFVVFLNNDTVAQPGWLEALIAAADDASVGAVGSRLLYPDGTIQHAGIHFHDGRPEHVFRRKAADFPAAMTQRDYPAVTGACILFRRDLLEKIGGFSEEYTMYVEDVDLCLSVWDAGFRVVYEPASLLFHLESASVVDLAGRDELVRAGWAIMRARWEGRWPAALPGGAPDVGNATGERLDGTRTFVTIAFADELVGDPLLLAAYAGAFGPDDDATLIVYAPDSEAGHTETELGEALATVGIDPARCPDVMAVYAPPSATTHLKLAAAVNAVLTKRGLGHPYDRLKQFDADTVRNLRTLALGEPAQLAA
jgi:GT2 family glycosyltransferase